MELSFNRYLLLQLAPFILIKQNVHMAWLLLLIGGLVAYLRIKDLSKQIKVLNDRVKSLENKIGGKITGPPPPMSIIEEKETIITPEKSSPIKLDTPVFIVSGSSFIS